MGAFMIRKIRISSLIHAAKSSRSVQVGNTVPSVLDFKSGGGTPNVGYTIEGFLPTTLRSRDTVTVRQGSMLGAREGLATRREGLKTGRAVIRDGV